MTEWEDQNGVGPRVEKDQPLVKIRGREMILNAAFTKLADIRDQGMRVTFRFSSNQWKIRLRFGPEERWSLFPDGGGWGRKGRKVAGGRAVAFRNVLKKYKWVDAVRKAGKLNPSCSQFTPKRVTDRSKWWEIQLCPAFEEEASWENRGSISRDVVGIYRYKRKGEVVYIGRGRVHDRLVEDSEDRDTWDIDTIQYSPMPSDNETQQREIENWEAWWIDKHREETGKLPLFNKRREHTK